MECWQPIQGGTQRAMDFMATHGIQGVVGGGSAEGGAMHRVVLAWHDAHARLGQHLELGERLCFGFHFYIADGREQGMREAAKYYEENLKMFGPLRLVRALTDEQIEDMADPPRRPMPGCPRSRRPSTKAACCAARPRDYRAPQEAGRTLSRAGSDLGEPVRWRAPGGALEQLERFATEVMPAFKTAAAEPAGVD